MRTNKSLALIVFAQVVCGAMVGAKPGTNDWSQPTVITLPAEGGDVQGLVQYYKNASLVFIPESQLLWIGTAIFQEHQKYVCLSNAIIRIASDFDYLLINQQAIRLMGSPQEQEEAKAQIMADFEIKLNEGFKSPNIRVYLGEVLFGNGTLSPFLPPEQRVHTAKAASISDIKVENGILSLPLIGKNNIKVALDFDNSMNVIKGTITDDTGHQPWPMILKAQVTLKPEALEVSPGILTAHVRLPWGYSVKNITSATCDGAAPERMTLSTAGGSASGGNDDKTEVIIKFRRQDIEAALAKIGKSIDTNFVVRGVWQSATATNFFQGTDSIKKIVGGKSK